MPAGEFDPEDSRQVMVGQGVGGVAPDGPPHRFLCGGGHEFRLVHAPQQEEQLRPGVEPVADRIGHRRQVLAELGPVGAGTPERHLPWPGKHPVARPGQPPHHVVGQPAGEAQSSAGGDPASVLPAAGNP